MVQLSTQPCLQVERFNENKRKKVLLKYKDIRVRAANEIKNMWFNLADKKSVFIPLMIEPFMKVALIPIADVHAAIIPLFFDMINCELYERGSEFEKCIVPIHLITTIDTQVALGNGDHQFRNAFEKM
jgi:hypothetical protein